VIRWRKVLRDITETPGRSALAILSMAAGIFGVGAMLTAYSILERELARTYEDTRPASAILLTNPLTDEGVARVRRMPRVLDGEARPMIGGRLRVGPDQWVPLVLFVVRDFDDQRLDRFRLDTGRWPREGEVVIERSAMSVARSQVGQEVFVRWNGNDESLRIAGTVHAAGLAPGWMDHVVTGFVRWRPMRDSALRVSVRCGTSSEGTAVLEPCLDEPSIRREAEEVAAQLRASGVTVSRIEIPPPGRHPHAAQMETFLYLLGAFGLLTLVLSAVLVATMIHALLVNQLREIGVMKTIGASTQQILIMSVGHVVLLASAALLIALPLALAAGRGYAQFASSMLNATLRSESVAPAVVALQIVVAILVPVGVSLIPIRRASRVPILETLRQDSSARSFGLRALDRWLARLTFLSRPAILSLRTSLQRRGRMLLSISTLAVGGAVFMAALNVSLSWARAVESDALSRRYDLEIRLAQRMNTIELHQLLRTLPQVRGVESWVEGRLGTTSVIGVDPDTPMLALPLIQGRWLRNRGEAVVNQAFLAEGAAAPSGLRVVGVVKEMVPGVRLYLDREDALQRTGASSQLTRNAYIVTQSHSAEDAQAIERLLERAGHEVAHAQRVVDRRKAIEDHLVIIESVLFFAATLVVLVGSLGLMATLTLNVFSRTHELGVLQAIGASPRFLGVQVVAEGVLIAFLSWIAAVVISAPATWLLDQATGRIYLKTPVEFLLSGQAILTWLALVLVLGAISSFYPAWRATRLSIKEAIAHE
jgi:putative ABC transport system permease protein